MQLRPYQRDAIDAVYDHLRTRDDNPCVVIPTAGGKTPCLASICKDAVQKWDGRVLILAHVKELLEQAADKLQAICPEIWFGIYSAGLKRRDTDHPVIIAGIQSVYKRACELDAFDLVLVDECFVAGTAISTPSGPLPIERVQPGMVVHNATGIGRVVAVSAKSVNELVTLEYSDGTTITCTANHPIFTECGWQSAGSLEVGALAFGQKDLRLLREGVSSMAQAAAGWDSNGPEGKAVAQAALLLDLLFEDSRKLHAIAGCPQEGQYGAESCGSRTEDARRQRPADDSAEDALAATGRRLGCGVHGAGAGLPNAYAAKESEHRRGAPAEDDRDRVGWIKPPIARPTPSRFSQDGLPGAKRLVRVSRDQSASGRVVFNLQVTGHPSYFANNILAHNCHMIPPSGDGMYQQFLRDAKVTNPNVRVIGFTATPYRMTTGMICSPAPDGLLNHICYEAGIKELIRDGYLCPLITKAGRHKANTDELHVRGGEFIASEVEVLMDNDFLVRSACTEIMQHTANRQACLIFASGVKHGKHIQSELEKNHGVECGFVDGNTPSLFRDELLKRFRDGELKYLCNVNVLTTGFDAPNIDCVALVRPTMSPGLYYQMVGRGFRLHPGKEDCLVLDFGGNVMRHGPVDQIKVEEKKTKSNGEAPAKECPNCQSVVSAGYALCPDCGYEFPPPESSKHEAEATNAGILSGQFTDTERTVNRIFYNVHEKRDAPPNAPKTMRVEYQTGFNEFTSEWICFEHIGFARRKAEQWWIKRSSESIPSTAEEAVELAEAGALCDTLSITVRETAGERFGKIIGYELGEKHDHVTVPEFTIDEDDIPF